MSKVAAVIVAFQPDRERLKTLAKLLSEGCALIFVMDNGGARDAFAGPSASPSTLRLIDMGENRGVGAALNVGFRLAAEAGMDFVISFDQDSTPPLDLAATLVESLEKLQAAGTNIGAVGPRIVNLRNEQRDEHPFMQSSSGWPSSKLCSNDAEAIEVDYLMTSGCLIPVTTFRTVGPFNEEFFVDCVDMEWCFRARWTGFQIFGICSVSMGHELGSGANVTAFGITLLGHVPVRRYYYARNTMRLIGAPYVQLGWKIRLLLGLVARLILLPLSSAFRPGFGEHWRMLFQGTLHGARGKSGPLRP
jgi:rhamnosyltransferase